MVVNLTYHGFFCNRNIDGSSFEVSVVHCFLDGAQIRTFHYVMCAKRMPQTVNRRPLNTCCFEIFGNHFFDPSWLHWFAELGNKKCWTSNVWTDGEPFLECSTRFEIKRECALPSPLPLNEHAPCVGWVTINVGRQFNVIHG